jgi:hypothetical protein
MKTRKGWKNSCIADRFNQLLFAYDLISDILGAGETDPNVEFVFNFHFISLVKSLGDNLAWMLMLYLKLEFEDRDIDLLRDHLRTNSKVLIYRWHLLYMTIHNSPNLKL